MGLCTPCAGTRPGAADPTRSKAANPPPRWLHRVGRGLQILGVTGVVRYWLYQFGVGAAPKVGKTNGGRRPSILLERRGGLLGSIVAARGVAWASFWGLWAPLGIHFEVWGRAWALFLGL